MFKYTFPIAATLLLAGCFSDDDGTNNQRAELSCLNGTGSNSSYMVVAAANSPDFQTSDMLFLTPNDEGSFELRQNEFSTTDPSDIMLSTYRNCLFRMNRSLHSISSYDVTSSGQVNFAWENSVLGGDDRANPYSLVVDAHGRGFVTRYDADDLWIVDLGAAVQEDFLNTELVLSAYAIDEDNVPRMSDAIIIGDTLYVLVERLHVEGDVYEARESSQLVVIDLDGTPSIESAIDLQVRNATGLTAVDDLIYVVGRGNSWAGQAVGQCKGGIAVVDTAGSNAVAVLMEDCDAEDEYLFGRLTGLTVVDADNGYFIGSAGWGNDTLYHFNPTAVNVEASVSEVAGTSGRGLGGLLHVANSDAGVASDVVFVSRSASSDGDVSAEIMVLDVSTAPTAVSQRITTTFNPAGMALLQLP